MVPHLSAKRFPELFLIILLLVFPVSLNASETGEFKILIEKFNRGDEDPFEKNAFSFLKKYPGSEYIPEVRMMLAEIESDTELAAERYRSVVRYYPSYKKRGLALYKLCQILDLKSKWKELKEESYQGIKLFSSSSYGIEFRFMHITSLIMLEDYGKAKSEALEITEKSHDYNTLSRAIFLLSEIDRKTTGNSRSYIYSLRELAVGFNKSELHPSTLYRLAQFYDEKKDQDRAYSAYTDIVKLFPESPEADMAILRIDKLKTLNPKTVEYIPDSELINNAEMLDISPEYTVQETKEDIFFSISVGPFTREDDADRMSRLLKNYPARRNIKARSGYFLYIGKFSDTDRALQTRIRLAEEYGINGNIVRFSEQGNRSYIYGD